MNKKDLRLVFLGTPDFGLPSLDMLYNSGFNIIACISQPDRKAGRGHRVIQTPVKTWALEHDIKCFQPEKISSKDGIELLSRLNPNICITAAYGQILSEDLIAIPELGIFNIHASLLPKYRGSAPINWALINGETETGITIMKTVRKLDAGDILYQSKININSDETAGVLYDRLSDLGAITLKEFLDKLVNNQLRPVAQNESEATYFPQFDKSFGKIDFHESCSNIYNFCRGTNPYPGCYFIYNDNKFKVISLSYRTVHHCYECGEIVKADYRNGIIVACKDGLINIEKIKYPGKGITDTKSFMLGHNIDLGTVLE